MSVTKSFNKGTSTKNATFNGPSVIILRIFSQKIGKKLAY
jgi:hypothetical protein